MKIIKTYFYLIVFFMIASFIFNYDSEENTLNPFDYARITDVEYKAVLVDEPNSEGKVVITEKLTFDVHAASKNNPFWELWRDLPEDYIDGLKVHYKVKSVKQIKDNKEITYQESPKLYWDDYDYVEENSKFGPGKWFHSPGPYNEYLRNYECVLFYIDGVYREKMVFEIEYEMYNAALKYNDSSELYLSMYSEETIKYLDSYKAEILIPNKDMPRKGNYEAHTYGTNSNSFEFTESKVDNPGYHTFAFELNKQDLKFKPYNQYIEFSLVSFGEDKHIFTDYANNNMYTRDDVLEEFRFEQKKYDEAPIIAKKNKTMTLLYCIGASALIILFSIIQIKRLKKRFNFYKPTMDMQYFRDIPSDLDPYFAAHLVFCKDKESKDKTNGYSAIMLSLVRKKYIELDRINDSLGWNNDNIKIKLKYKSSLTINQTIENELTTLNDFVNSVDKKESNFDVFESSISQPNTFESPFNFTINNKPLTNNIIEPKPIFNNTDYEPLTPSEEYYFNIISRHSIGDEISMKQFQRDVSSDYENTNSFINNIDASITNIGINQGYFQKVNYKQPRNEIRALANIWMILGIISITIINYIIYQTRLDLAFGGFFILGIALIYSSIYLKKQANKYVLLTQFGEDEYAKWRGLYNFLNSHTLMNEKTVIELPLWEKYLVYATAFGISDKVIKALKIRCPEYVQSEMLNNPYYSSHNYHTSSRSFHTATRHARSTYRTNLYSGSYGGHGGYGGGGRGGGGGGGGH